MCISQSVRMCMYTYIYVSLCKVSTLLYNPKPKLYNHLISIVPPIFYFLPKFGLFSFVPPLYLFTFYVESS